MPVEKGLGAGGDSSMNLLQESLDATGATILGKRMFGGWDGPWGDDPTIAIWGEAPPKLERTRVVESPR